MTSDSGGDGGKQKPANDNRPPNGQDAGNEVDAAERLDAVVLTIARLIGRRMAREDFEKAMRLPTIMHLPPVTRPDRMPTTNTN